ncbi:MAG: TraR/DksA family transcriptional regulator [Proteobacteria bacterium]|nr:TraR/DksA family transcriptional regulator [Pseudomonadota bacterium]
MRGRVNKRINGLTETQLEKLKEALSARRDELMRSILERSGNYRIEADHNIEYLDRAATVQHQAVTLRVMDKENKLLKQIERALSMIETGRYGLCEATDEPIGYPRLKAVPWARYSIAHKEQREQEQYLRSARLAGR